MRYLRFLTYILLLAAVVLSNRSGVSVIPLELEPPSYLQQAMTRVAAEPKWRLLSSSIHPEGGLPNGVEWITAEGADFRVWRAALGEGQKHVTFGVYVGGHPRVTLPNRGLAPGVVAGLPVLWWQHEAEDYRTWWESIMPLPSEGSPSFMHVWIVSWNPKLNEEMAVHLQSLRLVAPGISSFSPNKSLQPTATAVSPAAHEHDIAAVAVAEH